MKKDGPVTLANYSISNELTEKSIWKWANRYEKNAKKLKKMVRNLISIKISSRGVK